MSKEWLEELHKDVLYYVPFYDDEVRLAEIFYEEDGGWCYSSELLNADKEYLGSDSKEEARQEVEDLILEHFENEIEYAKHLLKSFKDWWT